MQNNQVFPNAACGAINTANCEGVKYWKYKTNDIGQKIKIKKHLKYKFRTGNFLCTSIFLFSNRTLVTYSSTY